MAFSCKHIHGTLSQPLELLTNKFNAFFCCQIGIKKLKGRLHKVGQFFLEVGQNLKGKTSFSLWFNFDAVIHKVN